MASIFNLFRSGGAYSKSTTGVSSSSETQLSQKDEIDTTTTKLTDNNNNNSSSGERGRIKEENIEINNSNTTTKVLTSSSSSSSQIIDHGKSMILSIQISGDSPPQYYETDLQDLIKLKEHLQYKPSVLNLVAVYQAEIQKHVEFGQSTKKKLKNNNNNKKHNKKAQSMLTTCSQELDHLNNLTQVVLNYQIEPTPKHNAKYIYMTSSGLPAVYCTNSDLVDYSHFQALQEGKSVMHSFDSSQDGLKQIEEVLQKQTQISSNSEIAEQKKQLELLEKEYTKIMREKEKILLDRASILSSDELATIEEEEGQGKRSNQDEDEWEIERKKRIIENERKLIEKRLADSKKHRNVRFYCTGELEYLSKWNDHFIKTNKETTPKGLEELLRFSLHPTNRFDLGAEEIHFRFCESQFHRLAASPMYASSYPNARVVMVDYVVNPVIMKRFNARKKELAEKHGFMVESMKPLLLFHGTHEKSMENILKTNFLLNKIGSKTDMGYYGKGFYFSEYPGLSMAYSGNQYLLICMVLIGKAFHMAQVQTGRAIEPGYDSHVSPDGCSEVIIFDPDQVIPLYKITWAHN